MKPYSGNISREAFDLFISHLSMCAKEYRAASLRQTIQYVILPCIVIYPIKSILLSFCLIFLQIQGRGIG